MSAGNRNFTPGITSVLFVCNKNLVRSPMAEALLKMQLAQWSKRAVFVESVGIDPDDEPDMAADIDGFVVSVMSELGQDLRRHHSKPLEMVDAQAFDLVICLSLPAYDICKPIATFSATEVEYWDVIDPSKVSGNRDQRLGFYREIRDHLSAEIEKRFFD